MIKAAGFIIWSLVVLLNFVAFKFVEENRHGDRYCVENIVPLLMIINMATAGFVVALWSELP